MLSSIRKDDLESVVSAHRKLQVIARSLTGIKGGNGRVATATEYVVSECEKLKDAVLV